MVTGSSTFKKPRTPTRPRKKTQKKAKSSAFGIVCFACYVLWIKFLCLNINLCIMCCATFYSLLVNDLAMGDSSSDSSETEVFFCELICMHVI